MGTPSPRVPHSKGLTGMGKALVPANKGLSPIVPHNKGVRSAAGHSCQLLVASCQK